MKTVALVIVPIVEGHGEVQAVPTLLRRLVGAAEAWAEVRVGRPIRCSRSQLVDEIHLRKRVRLARRREHRSAVLIIFDSDDDCPVEIAVQVRGWAVSEAGPYCEVVLAKCEYEAWFLATVESLRTHSDMMDDAQSHPQPESPRDAKGRLAAMMHTSYSETVHQPAFSDIFCMAAAYARCRSFRKLIGSFGRLIEGEGVHLPAWPPPAWLDRHRQHLAPQSR